ncbi:MAG TPA: LacI family DNA-binding transcriptional regulator [Micromonosporaceae bacterium]|nr:LacI family DNA-binding transcriptional regulator [Micromonosporaceae bacterium]
MTRPRIQDVAERAGVSITTVSHVLNGHPRARVAPATAERVRRAAAEAGYVPNPLARGLRTRRSHTIGFLGDVIATTPFAVGLVEAAQEAAWRRGHLLFLLNTGGDVELERAAVAALQQQQVAGIVYATMYHRVVSVPEGLGPNAVLLDCRTVEGGYRSVVPDERQGAHDAVSELLALGHRRIGFLNDELAPEAAHLRLRGYREALAEYDVRFDPRLVRASFPDASGGARAAAGLLDQPTDSWPTAIFCFNDRMAMGVYGTARRLGLQIPQDVSIVGFDDMEYLAAEIDPPLTTVALPHREMGRSAVEKLLDEPAGADPPTRIEPVLVPCPLVRRNSVGPPPPRASRGAR